MIEFGSTLRAAREAKGLTISQIAESTHMMASIVQDMENENFTRIVAPIYGRGFVKLYCEAVGIDDPKPLIAEFMEIYSGNRVPTIRERPVAAASESAPEPAPAPEPQPETPVPEPAPAPEPQPETPVPEPAPAPEPQPEPIPEPPPIVTPFPKPAQEVSAPPPAPMAKEPPPADLGPLFGVPAEPAEEPPAEPVRETPPQTSAEPSETPQAPARTLSRYASPLHEEPKRSSVKLPSISIPPSFWRLFILAIVAGLVLWGVFLGVRALYRITNDIPPADATEEETPVATPPAETTAPVTAPSPAQAKAEPPAAQPKPVQAPRTPQKIPSLYVD